MLTLQSMLDAKEQRVHRRNELHKQFPDAAIVSITLNIPGPTKDSPILRDLFNTAVAMFIAECPAFIKCLKYFDITGPHGLIAIRKAPAKVKEITCRLETAHTYSRLWDMDVFDKFGIHIASPFRRQGRHCFICDQPSIICMREHRHTQKEITNKVNELLAEFEYEKQYPPTLIGNLMGQYATQAALYEAACYPSPGLVDSVHPGAHKDMDFYTFLNSSTALHKWFCRFFDAGLHHTGTPKQLFQLLRHIGKKAESDMYMATNNINTHKGLIFSMGLLLGAIGKIMQLNKPISVQTIPEMIQKIADGISKELRSSIPPETAGEKFYFLYNITGIRGEAEQGFPAIFNNALMILAKDMIYQVPINKALLHTLFVLISCTDDTTILHRQPDLTILRRIQHQAQQILDDNTFQKNNWQERLWAVDKEWVDLNISPGGSADLLTLTYFLYELLYGKLSQTLLHIETSN